MFEQIIQYSNHLLYWFTWISIIGMIFFLIKSKKYFFKLFKKIGKNYFIVLMLIFIIGLFLRINMSPHQHIVYIDEPWHMAGAVELIENQSFSDYSKSTGWPFFVHIMFLIFGINNIVGINTSILFGSLSVILIFLLSYVITKNRFTSILSATMLAMMPLHIRWSTTAETNVFSLFFMMLSLLFCFMLFSKKKKKLFWLTCYTVAFTCMIRPENYILILIFLMGLKIKKINIKKKAILLLLILVIPNFIQIGTSYGSTQWKFSDTNGKINEENWSFENLISNSIEYGQNIFFGVFHPSWIILMTLLGSYFLYNKKKNKFFILAFYFIGLWIIYFSSWFDTVGGPERFYIMFYPITLMLTGYAISSLIMKFNIQKLKFLVFCIVFILMIPYGMKAELLYSDNEHKLETIIPELAKNDIPKECAIIMNTPIIMTATTNFEGVDLNLFLNEYQYQQRIMEESDCLLFFEDFSCYVWPLHGFKENCAEIKEKFQMQSYSVYEYSGTVFTFYRIR